MLKAAGTYLQARSQETSRFWYFTASFAMTAPFIVVGVAFWLWRGALTRALGPGLFWLVSSATAGSLGALLSVIGRTGKLTLDCSAGRALHYLEGASRIWAGALSGSIVALAVRTEVILAPLSRGEKTPAVMMLAALARGAGERLATSIISRVGAEGAEVPPDKTTPSVKEFKLTEFGFTVRLYIACKRLSDHNREEESAHEKWQVEDNLIGPGTGDVVRRGLVIRPGAARADPGHSH
jgi:hypothetical protein